MATDLKTLEQQLKDALGDKVVSLEHACDELTLTLKASSLLAACTILRDDPALRFDQLMDLCGIDYSTYGSGSSEDGRYLVDDPDAPAAFPHRFAVISHLLSIVHNVRLRVRVFAEDDSVPAVDSVTGLWPVASWFEREAFDLYGIIFSGHPDLRRLLTDYGFVGNPFRKDFPLSGHVEMRYDPEQRRVVYQPVTVEPREVTPRTLREENYGR